MTARRVVIFFFITSYFACNGLWTEPMARGSREGVVPISTVGLLGRRAIHTSILLGYHSLVSELRRISLFLHPLGQGGP